MLGVPMFYHSLAGLLNTTTVRIHNGALTIRHHPLPWFGSLTLEFSEIKQVYVKEIIHGENNRSYEVWAILDFDTHKMILKDLSDVEHGLYFEQEIERVLKIKDRPVPGEVKY